MRLKEVRGKLQVEVGCWRGRGSWKEREARPPELSITCPGPPLPQPPRLWGGREPAASEGQRGSWRGWVTAQGVPGSLT